MDNAAKKLIEIVDKYEASTLSNDSKTYIHRSHLQMLYSMTEFLGTELGLDGFENFTIDRLNKLHEIWPN